MLQSNLDLAGVDIVCVGHKLNLTRDAYFDPARGQVMAPLKDAVTALGGKVSWVRLPEDYRETAAEQSYQPSTVGK